MYECNVLDFPALLSGYRLQGDWLERQEFLNQALSRHRLILGNRLNGLDDIKSPADLYRTFAATRSASYWGEKAPAYARRLSRLVKEYPKASFILIWRDPEEIFRSIQIAGKADAYFRRAGMLHRIIHGQEEMVRFAARMQGDRLRIHQIEYNQLIDETDATMREICRFLEVEYHPDMACLKHADFTGLYEAVHHEHLRQGTIVRRKHSPQAVEMTLSKKLRRFYARWNRLRGRAAAGTPEPAFWELWWHRVAGSFFLAFDNSKRLAFEFLPLTWLQTYRDFKEWFAASYRQRAVNNETFLDRVRANILSIGCAYGFLAGVAAVKYFTHTHLVFAPLYLVSPAFLTLIINRRWGAAMAAIAAILWAGLNFPYSRLADHLGVMAWNAAMHFLLILFLVLLLDRIRQDFSSRTTKPALQY